MAKVVIKMLQGSTVTQAVIGGSISLTYSLFVESMSANKLRKSVDKVCHFEGSLRVLVLNDVRFICECQADEVDADAVEETPITPAQAGTQAAAAAPRRRTARTAIKKARGPLSTKAQDMQVSCRRIVDSAD